MSDWQKATCHCGAVELRVMLEDGMNTIRRCDCSFCRPSMVARIMSATMTCLAWREAPPSRTLDFGTIPHSTAASSASSRVRTSCTALPRSSFCSGVPLMTRRAGPPMLLKRSSSRGERSVKTPSDPDRAAPEIHQCRCGFPIKNAPVCVGHVAFCLELQRPTLTQGNRPPRTQGHCAV